MKVSLFITCLGDMFYPEIGKDVVELLEKLGCEIDFPQSQTCCGQPAFNSGYHKEAVKAAKHMMEVFEHAEVVVTPSGSCAAMFKEYPSLFKDNPEWRLRAERLAKKTYEFTQFLYRILKVTDTGAVFNGTAVYHTSCHMSRLLGETEAPYELLSNVRGLDLVELPNKQNCCGFGGTFAVKMNQISEQMVDEKVAHAEGTGASILIGADSGCLMNIGGRIGKEKKPMKAMHIAQVLNHTEH